MLPADQVLFKANCLILWSIIIGSMGEKKSCPTSRRWFKDELDFFRSNLLRVMIPPPRKVEQLCWLEGGIVSAEMPVHLRPTQVIGSSLPGLNFGFIWPPLLKQRWLSPIVEESRRNCRREICLKHKYFCARGQLSYGHMCYLFRFVSLQNTNRTVQYSIGNRGKKQSLAR